jgi:coenzyme F420 hydrogenase subunit beta
MELRMKMEAMKPKRLASPVLDRVMSSDCCSGCGLCASIAPQSVVMEMSTEGFLRPTQRAEITSVQEAHIANTCPGAIVESADSKLTEADVETHHLWGPVLRTRVGHSTNSDIRQHASSGGVISALLTELVETAEVDYVVQIGPSGMSAIDNQVFQNRDAKSVYQAAGSRYAPSSPLERFSHFLDQPGRFALVGKPCDIAAARAFARLDSRVDEKVAYMISFFCAGIPSRGGTVAILKELGLQESEVTSFQYRGDGWPGFATARTRAGRVERMTYMNSWGGILSKRVQFRCKICPDGVGGQADVVCADAWESDEKGYPRFEETDGHSLIVSRTRKGEDLVLKALEKKVIEARDFPLHDIMNIQPSQAKRKQQVLARTSAMRLARKSPPSYVNQQIWKAAISAGLINNVRGFLGTLRRLW